MPNAAELDEALLAAVRAWHCTGERLTEAQFDAHARALFAYQLERNEPYRRYAGTLGIDGGHPPASWRAIPAVPASAFKDATLATFDVRAAERTFHTSGTTGAASGKHYLERVALYDTVLLAGFDRFMLPDAAKLRYLSFVPNPRFKPHSSLGYMMGHVAVLRGDGRAQYFLDGDDVDVPGFRRAMDEALRAAQPVCIAGTAFAFVTLTDALAAQGLAYQAPAGSRIMETGGFKGRVRAVERETLYAALSRTLGIPEATIVAEYGMTELTSQYYDDAVGRERSPRVKVAPPWLRTVVCDADGREVPYGEIGTLRHVDLANRSSAVAIATEDRGYAARSADGTPGIVLLGRAPAAPERGCSLDAEDLAARA